MPTKEEVTKMKLAEAGKNKNNRKFCVKCGKDTYHVLEMAKQFRCATCGTLLK